jgi:hypothetical protein
MLSNWQTLSLIPTRTNTDSSCSVLCRASTSRNVSQIKEVHGRDNLGHAAAGRSRMTLFGIMACKIQSRLWAKSYVLTLGLPLPVYPHERTSSDRPGWSGSCQKPTYARQQTAALLDHLAARPSSAGGIVRPSVLAVLRFMANSIFVICCTGRSAAFSPLRMRPV